MTTQNQFTAVFKKTGKWFVGWVEEIPGVNTQGKTIAEARQNLREALLLVLESNRESARSYETTHSSFHRELLNIKIPA